MHVVSTSYLHTTPSATPKQHKLLVLNKQFSLHRKTSITPSSQKCLADDTGAPWNRSDKLTQVCASDSGRGSEGDHVIIISDAPDYCLCCMTTTFMGSPTTYSATIATEPSPMPAGVSRI